MAALVYRHMLAPTFEAGAAPMQALLGEPDGAIGSPIGSPGADRQASGRSDDGASPGHGGWRRWDSLAALVRGSAASYGTSDRVPTL